MTHILQRFNRKIDSFKLISFGQRKDNAMEPKAMRDNDKRIYILPLINKDLKDKVELSRFNAHFIVS